MREVLKKFGRYFLLDQIAQGGMAEIYRARDSLGEGPVRLFAIKRIISLHGRDTEYLKMFQSEIDVTVNFSHPNLVTVLGHGMEQGDPYIAMEYVDGRSIRQMTSRCLERKKTIPVEAAAMIAMQAAAGLHYAHSFKDMITGESLNVVHRDISPQNILISYDGTVKIIDFGIAKASINTEATRAGLIKGKPSYLSPEQVTGEKLDGRCDVFALGIVLWEMLVGTKLFLGENDLAILKMIESAQTHVKPPSTLNSAVPKELDAIVMRALSKRREDRYQSGEEFSIALNRFLRAYAAEYLANNLGACLKELFKNEILEDRKHLQKMNEQAEQLLIMSDISRNVISEVYPGSSSDSRTVPLPVKEGTTMIGRGRPGAAPVPLKPTQSGPSPTPPLPPSLGTRGIPTVELDSPTKNSGSVGSRSRSTLPAAEQGAHSASRSTDIFFPPPPRTANGIKYAVAAAALAAALYFGQDFSKNWRKGEASTPKVQSEAAATLVLNGNQKNISIALNGQVVGDSLPMTLKDVPTGSPLHILVSGDGVSFEQELTLAQGESRKLDVNLQAVQVQPQSADSKLVQLRFNLLGVTGDASIMVNGQAVDFRNPIIQVPMNEALELVVEKEGFRRMQRQFVLDSREVAPVVREKGEWTMDVAMDSIKFGYLTIHSTPSATIQFTQSGRVIVPGASPGDGTRVPAEIVRTPLENVRLPIGTYNIRMTNDVLGMEKIVTVTVEDGKARLIDERLEIKN